MWDVIRLRDRDQLDALAASLAEVERATAEVDLGGALRPNRRSLEFALRKLRFHRDRKGCLCELYPDFLQYDPDVEAAAGNVVVVGTRHVDGRWVEAHRCRCTACGAVYDVRHGEAHTPWWEWRREASDPHVT